MKPLIVALALAACVAPASAKEKCTSMCHLFDAWAMTQRCPNLTLKHTPDNDATYRDLLNAPSFRLKIDALRQLNPATDCDVECKGTDADDGTVCQYIVKKPTPASSTAASAFSDDFVNGIAYTVIYDRQCKPGSVSPWAYNMMNRATDAMTVGEMNHIGDLIRQSQDPAQKDTWQTWCAVMTSNGFDQYIKQLNDSAAAAMRQ